MNRSPSDLLAQLERAFLAQVEVQRVLKAQVEGALETSHQLASTVIQEAHATHEVATGLARNMARASEAAGRVLERVGEAIDTADVLEREVLQERMQRLEQASQSSERMVCAQRKLERLGGKASDLGVRIRIVAMNTNIEAMRSQTANGSTIGVLAREIGGLAEEVQKLGLELSDSVQTLSQHLQRDVVESIASEAQALEELRGHLAQQVVSLRESHENLLDFRDSALRQVESDSRQVSVHAYNTLGGVQNQDILRQRLEQVVNTFARLARHDAVLRSALLGEAPLPPDWSPLDAADLRAEYVMDAQRSAHGADDEAEQGGPAIELF